MYWQYVFKSECVGHPGHQLPFTDRTGYIEIAKDGHIDLVRQGPYVGQKQRGHISTFLY